jgi:hypothetical protein
MSEQRRPRIRAPAPPRRVGEPNVLSDQAIPNRLSTMGKPGGIASPAAAPNRPTTQPVLAPSQPISRSQPDPRIEQAPRPRRRFSPGALITVAFVIFAVARFLNNLDLGGAAGTGPPLATTEPRPSLLARPTIDSSPGLVVFGESVTANGCDLEHVAVRFRAGIDIWWQAEMSHLVDADATVVYVATRDGLEVDREVLPPDPEVGEWTVLCGGRPVPGYVPGEYRIEIRNEAETEVLSSGTFTKIK